VDTVKGAVSQEMAKVPEQVSSSSSSSSSSKSSSSSSSKSMTYCAILRRD